MKTQTGRLALVMVMLWIGFRVGHRAEAGGIALNTPAGLSPGESFRFVFITDGATTAISSSIATYNSFVNVQAGSAAYAGSVVNWVAIGSTSSVAGCSPTTTRWIDTSYSSSISAQADATIAPSDAAGGAGR